MASCSAHTVAPLALACWLPSLRRRGLLIAASLLSAAPDRDTIGYFLGVPYEAPCGHRGCTRSFAFATSSHGLIDMATNGGHGIALFWPFAAARLSWPFRPIEVAPLSVRGFFTADGLAVLASEAIWLWLPAVVVGAVGLAVRRAAPSSVAVGATTCSSESTSSS
jgi:inner membrane protein